VCLRTQMELVTLAQEMHNNLASVTQPDQSELQPAAGSGTTAGPSSAEPHRPDSHCPAPLPLPLSSIEEHLFSGELHCSRFSSGGCSCRLALPAPPDPDAPPRSQQLAIHCPLLAFLVAAYKSVKRNIVSVAMRQVLQRPKRLAA